MKGAFYKALMALMPQAVRNRLIRIDERFLTVTTDSDHLIELSNPLYSGFQMLVNPKYAIEYSIAAKGIYDPKMVNMIHRLVGHSDVVFDVGANCGSMTLPIVSRLGELGTIVAVEPGPLLFSRLSNNIDLNKSRIKAQCHLLNIGLAKKEGAMYWEMDTGPNYGNASIVDYHTDVKVDVSTLGSVVKALQLNKIDYIKIDVEGMEWEILNSSADLLSKFKPTLLFESWVSEDVSNCTTKNCYDLLEQLGYKFFEPSVGEADLWDVLIRYELVEVVYPKCPQNTLAIHISKIDQLRARLEDSFQN